MACAQTALIQPDTSIVARRKAIPNVVRYLNKKAALVSGFLFECVMVYRIILLPSSSLGAYKGFMHYQAGAWENEKKCSPIFK